MRYARFILKAAQIIWKWTVDHSLNYSLSSLFQTQMLNAWQLMSDELIVQRPKIRLCTGLGRGVG